MLDQKQRTGVVILRRLTECPFQSLFISNMSLYLFINYLQYMFLQTTDMVKSYVVKPLWKILWPCHLKYPVVSHLQISKHHLKQRSLTCQPSHLAVSPLNLPSSSWKSAQIQVTWTLHEGLWKCWCDMNETHTSNICMVCRKIQLPHFILATD